MMLNDQDVKILLDVLDYAQEQFNTSCINTTRLKDECFQEYTDEVKQNLEKYEKAIWLSEKALVNRERMIDDGKIWARLTYSHGITKYIFIFINDMIFISDYDWETFSELLKEDYDDYEAYDMSDGCAYYHDSAYATEISELLMYYCANVWR